MTDILVNEGYASVGYEYINVDDCWPERERDARGRLVPDRERFPYGMKSLADYVSIACFLKRFYLALPVFLIVLKLCETFFSHFYWTDYYDTLNIQEVPVTIIKMSQKWN